MTETDWNWHAYAFPRDAINKVLGWECKSDNGFSFLVIVPHAFTGFSLNRLKTYTQTHFIPFRHLAWKLSGQWDTATFSSLVGQQQVISHWVPIHSLPSHLWLPVVLPFEADLIPHTHTSIFLKRAGYDCFDPFHTRKLRPEQQATLKREVIASRRLFQIFSWLTWEHCMSFTWADNNASADCMNWETEDCRLSDERKMAPIRCVNDISRIKS